MAEENDKENGNGDPKGTEEDPKGGSGDDKKTFTQEEVNRMMGDRATRASGATEKQILEKLGVESLDDAEASIKAYRDRQEKEKSELQKAQDAKEAAENKAKDAEAKANEKLIRAEFIVEASKAGVEHPEDAYSLADRSKVKILDDGKVEGVADAVKVLVEAGRLPLTSQKKAADLDGGEGDGDKDKLEKLTAEEAEIAKKMGLTAEQYRMAKASSEAFTPVEKKKEKEK